MTMTMSPLMSERKQQPPPGGKRKEHSGLLAMPTREIKLSPEFVHALKQVAPKRRTHVLRYVLALAVLIAGVSLAVVPGARHRIASAWQHVWHGETAAASVAPATPAPATPTASVEQTPSAVVSAAPIVIPPVVISSAAPDTSSSSTRPSKPPKRWQRQSPR